LQRNGFLFLSVVAILCGAAAAARAEGTPAGTDINNQATVTYIQNGTVGSARSNLVSTAVAEVLEMSLTWQDAAAVDLIPGTRDGVLTFRLTNTGNGSDSFNLSGRSTIAGDDFDPEFKAIHLDTNDNGTFDPGADQPYIAGSNDPVLGADAFAVIFVLNDIPQTANVGETGMSLLAAASNTGTGSPGTVIPAAGERGLDAVVGSAGGRADETGSYRIVAAAAQVALVKSAVVVDPAGGSLPVRGAAITYSITVNATGDGTTDDVVVSDAIPANTTYIPGTLKLNGAPITDAVDTDAGDMGGTTPGRVTVVLGDLVTGEPGPIIAFTVTID
jgi:uncharacterized repeat protein (TIGR01451 family)